MEAKQNKKFIHHFPLGGRCTTQAAVKKVTFLTPFLTDPAQTVDMSCVLCVHTCKCSPFYFYFSHCCYLTPTRVCLPSDTQFLNAIVSAPSSIQQMNHPQISSATSGVLPPTNAHFPCAGYHKHLQMGHAQFCAHTYPFVPTTNTART